MKTQFDSIRINKTPSFYIIAYTKVNRCTILAYTNTRYLFICDYPDPTIHDTLKPILLLEKDHPVYATRSGLKQAEFSIVYSRLMTWT